MSCGNVIKAVDKENVLQDISTTYTGAGIHSLQVILKNGWIVQSHKHTYSHLAILLYGKVELTVDGVVATLVGPTSIVIEAGKVHTVRALADTMWLCVHRNDLDTKDIHELNRCLVSGDA